MTKRDTNLGFSIVEALLVLVVVGILGFTGWFIYHARQASDKDYSTASSSTVPTFKKTASAKARTSAPPAPKGAYLDLKEVGVKMTLSSSVSDATYAPYYTESSDGAKAYGISTKTLEADGSAGSACSASHGALGIVRVTTTAPMKFVPPNSETPMTPDNKTLFKIGSSYYQYVAPQEYGCSDGGKVSAADMQTAQAAVAQSFISVKSDAQ